MDRTWMAYERPRLSWWVYALGALLSALAAMIGFVALFIGASPSDPCAGATGCGPEPSRFLLVGLTLLAASVLGPLVLIVLGRRRSNLEFQVPPQWPTPPHRWRPDPGWRPDPTWPDPPASWEFWRKPSRP